jgi:hypothetical protein
LPKRNWIQHGASLREFLHTGTLGPVNLGLTMLEVSALLGPPQNWVTDASDCPVPLYWIFNRLEIAFQQKPPYAIDWFQIEHPDSLARPRHKLADLLDLSMDRINVSVPPSRMLRHFSDLSDIVVGAPKDVEDPTLEIYNRGVCLIYTVLDQDIETFPHKETDPHQWLRHFDRHCFIDSIYSFREPALRSQYPKSKFGNMSAAHYLAIAKDHGH